MKKLFFHSLLPLIGGGVIYLFIRPVNFVIHLVATKLLLFEPVNSIREASLSFYPYLPNIIVYNLPDGLWVYSFTAAILYVWKFQLNKWSIPFCLIPVILGVGSEFGQLFEMVPGTFDPLDAIFYTFGFILSVTILTSKRKDGKFKI